MSSQDNSSHMATNLSGPNAGNLTITSGFAKYPYKRDSFFNKNAVMWMKGKQKDDGIFPLWRIEDKLYDLTEFASSHPGGRFWIEGTRGTDITEAFEVSHLGTNPKTLLSKYFVREIHTRRNSPFTFEEDGFYKSFKRKVVPILKKVGTQPDWKSLLIQDFVFALFLIFMVLGTIQNSVALIFASGLFLFLSTNSAHNFLHQKDNWRMYYFDFMVLSSNDWRISHVLSHHLFPNTINDYEVTGLEPFFQVLPKSDKTLVSRYSVFFTANFVYAFGFYIDVLRKTLLVLMKEIEIRSENFIPVVELLAMMMIRGSPSQGLRLWFWLHTFANVMFLVHGVAVGHHHPHIFREGDQAIPNKDWGMLQIMATRNRSGVSNSFLLASLFFGNHTLHHLLPTVDHSKLPMVVAAFRETCQEFGMKFQDYSYWKLLSGFYLSHISMVPSKITQHALSKGM